ncbi:MAG: Ig-like domain-containing protein [Terriglobales bacterium]
MKRAALILVVLALACGCSRKQSKSVAPPATAFGTTIVEVSGGKQVVAAGATLDQPIVVQVNDAQGNGVAGAPVELRGASGAVFDPPAGLTDSSGQFTARATLGGSAGHYQLTAVTHDRSGKAYELKLDEIALDYQQVLGRELTQQYCNRCHDPESTPERVSNMDNLTTKPHAFNEGDVLNKSSDADLNSIISHGGAALNKSAEMPPYGYTLTKNDIQAVIAYIRAIADPPYPSKGLVYAKN